MAYLFEEIGPAALLLVIKLVNTIRVFCAPISVQPFNSVDVWVRSFLHQMVFLHTLPSQVYDIFQFLYPYLSKNPKKVIAQKIRNHKSLIERN